MAYRWLGAWLLIAACSVGCGNDGAGGSPFIGSGGAGGVGGSGGVGGAAGQSGAGGTAGTGGSSLACTTSALCRSCPTEAPCNSDAECSVGSVCIDSGCSAPSGAPIGQCVFAGGGACDTTDDCPPERECMEVPLEGKRCVKTTPGCTTRFDCVSGFSCENGECIDRRVPCNHDVDCPKNHTCWSAGFSSFCVRIHVDCVNEFDCAGLAPLCANVDGVGNLECAGVADPNAAPPLACLNDQCSGDPLAPVCESDALSGETTCGQYGLCLDDTDCAPSFVCAALWPDGRRECVPEGGSCSSFEQCPIRQVCASPQEGGPPSCQAGVEK